MQIRVSAVQNLGIALNISLISSLLVFCNLYSEYLGLLLVLLNVSLLYNLNKASYVLDVTLFIVCLIISLAYIIYYKSYFIYLDCVLSFIVSALALRQDYKHTNNVLSINVLFVGLWFISILFGLYVNNLNTEIANKEKEFYLIKEYWTEPWFYRQSINSSDVSQYFIE